MAVSARAAELSKCDLTTEMVKELTELQGIVGGLYARAQGEPADVWRAVYEHYKPLSMEDSIPSSAAGQVLSLADKVDTLRGCFEIGLMPTGSRDPFALRRAAQGVVRILVEGGLRIKLSDLIGDNAQLREFLLDRVSYYFRDVRGFKYDEVNSVLTPGTDDLVDVEARLQAIQQVRPTADFEPVAASFKRIANILRQAQFAGSVEWTPDFLKKALSWICIANFCARGTWFSPIDARGITGQRWRRLRRCAPKWIRFSTRCLSTRRKSVFVKTGCCC